MEFTIRSVKDEDVPKLIHLCLLAFEPIFDSFKQILGIQIFSVLYPDWKATQTNVVKGEISAEDVVVWVAEVEGKLAGLITQKVDQETRIGEVHFLAVHPDYQNRGIGTALIRFVLDRLRESGMDVAMVSTGGDVSHAPARHTYEKAGFIPLQIVNYYQKL